MKYWWIIFGIIIIIIAIFLFQEGKNFGGFVSTLFSVFSTLVAFEKSRKWMGDKWNNLVKWCKNKNCGKGKIFSKSLYEEYQNAEEELIIQISTWPVFGGKEEKALEKSQAKRIFILGPVEEPYTWPGVLWRFSILQQKIKNQTAYMFDLKEIPLPIKFIVVDGSIYTTSYTDKRSICYDEIQNPARDRIESLKSVVFDELFKTGNCALLKLYLAIYKKFRTNPPTNLEELITNIKNVFKQSIQDNEKILGDEHKDLIRNKQKLEKLIRENIKDFIEYVNDTYGLQYITINKNDQVTWNTSSSEEEVFNIFRNKFESTISYLMEESLPPVGNLPKIRLVITDDCKLSCVYCPPGNESYPSNGSGAIRSMNTKNFKSFLDHSYKLGFRNIAITGGEPLRGLSNGHVKALCDFLNNKEDVKIYINTTTITLCEHENSKNNSESKEFDDLLNQLEDYKDIIKDKIIFKISVDGILPKILEGDTKFGEFYKKQNSDMEFPSEPKGDFLSIYPKIRCSEYILNNIKKALDKGYQVGINFILSKDTKPFLKSTVIYFWYLYQGYKKDQLYFKILDLNWYRNLGKRKGNSKIGEAYWSNQYISPIRTFYELNLSNIFGDLTKIVNMQSGIPMVEANKEGFTIKIKDSALGTHYLNPQCLKCIYFVTNRCQEGVYQPWVTPEGNFKICYHNPQIVNEILGKNIRFNSINREQIFLIFRNLIFKKL